MSAVAATLAAAEETAARAALENLQAAHGLPAPRHVWWQDAPRLTGAGRVTCLHVEARNRTDAEAWARALKVKARAKNQFFDQCDGWSATRSVVVRVPDWQPGVVLRVSATEQADYYYAGRPGAR